MRSDALDALSVSVEDADAQTDAEQALFGEPGMPAPQEGWQRSRIGGTVPRRSRRQRSGRACCKRRTFSRAASVLGIAAGGGARLGAPDAVAVRASRNHARLLDRAHLARAARPGASAVIRLDPGLAFGTGTHPTTRMCLRWIARQAASRRRRSAGCWTTAVARASGHWRCQAWRHRD